MNKSDQSNTVCLSEIKPLPLGRRFQLSLQLLSLFVCNMIVSWNQAIDKFSTVLLQCKHRKERKRTLQKVAATCNKTWYKGKLHIEKISKHKHDLMLIKCVTTKTIHLLPYWPAEIVYWRSSKNRQCWVQWRDAHPSWLLQRREQSWQRSNWSCFSLMFW